MPTVKRPDVEAFREQHQRGVIAVFLATVFDEVKFDLVIDLVSFDELAVDECVRINKKRGIDASKSTFEVRFDDSLGDSSNLDADWFDRMHEFGAMYAHRVIHFDSTLFTVVKSEEWTFNESIVDKKIKDMTAKGIKAAKISRTVKFSNAFTISSVESIPA